MLKTKDLLAETLKRQLKTKVLEKITVTNIVQECEVNRQTFYYHFEDINDLAKYMYMRDLKRVISDKKNYNNWQGGCLATMLYLKENKEMVGNTLKSVDRKKLEISLNKGADHLMTGVVDEIAEDMDVSEADKEFIVKLYRIIFIGLITDWISHGMTEPPEQIIRNLNKMIQGNIRMALERFEDGES